MLLKFQKLARVVTAKGAWKRDTLTGLPVAGLPESLTNDRGEFDPSAFPDCEVFAVNSMAALAGCSADYFETVVVPSGMLHMHEVRGGSGKVITRATHSNTVTYGAKMFRDGQRGGGRPKGSKDKAPRSRNRSNTTQDEALRTERVFLATTVNQEFKKHEGKRAMRTNHISMLFALLATLLMPTAYGAPTVPAGYSIKLYATNMGAVSGLAFGPNGSVVVADYAGGRILRIAKSTGRVRTIATGLPYIIDVAFKTDGTMYAGLSGSGAVYRIAPDGVATPIASGFPYMATLSVWRDEIYVGSPNAAVVSKIDATGNVSSVLLSGTNMTNPYGLAFGAKGAMTFVDHPTGLVYSYDFLAPPKKLATITAYGGHDTGIGLGKRLFVSDAECGTLLIVKPDGTTRVFASGFAGKRAPPAIGPHDLLYDGASKMYVGDGNDIWLITAPVK